MGDDHAECVRSIRHPLVRTPNDIFAINSHEFLVTNDHHYREGRMRLVEDLGWDMAPWSNIIHIKLDPESHQSTDDVNPDAGVTASVALWRQQNMNGLGHGPDTTGILVGRASAGVLVHASLDRESISELKVSNSVQLGWKIDNPTYFSDPYAKETGRDASGYVLAGLLKAATFPTVEEKDPVVVWMLQSLPGKTLEQGNGRTEIEWNRTVVFEDDGSKISSASTAVVIAIDPAENEGKKQAWLFVTGPVSKAVVAARC